MFCAIMEEITKTYVIVGSDKILVHKARTDNEPWTALEVDSFTNYVGLVP